MENIWYSDLYVLSAIFNLLHSIHVHYDNNSNNKNLVFVNR